MNLFPPIPSWEGLHPLVVHFPVALLMVAPLFIMAGLFTKSSSRGLLVAAFSLMLLGTIAAWVAVGTGRATGETVEDTGGAKAEQVIEQHEQLAETTRNVFTALLVLFAAIVFVPGALGRPLGRLPSAAMHLAFLAFYGGGLVFLVNTAHQGGRLVHELGVRAMISPAQASGGMSPGGLAESEAEEARGRLTEPAAAPGETEGRGEVSKDRGTPVNPGSGKHAPAPAPSTEAGERGETAEATLR